MNPVVRNILAVIAGAVVGGIVNGIIIKISGSVIPHPEGVDVNNMESIVANIDKYEPKHFLMPWLAHALGTFVGALIAAKFAATHKMKMALIIGVLFLIGGISAVAMIPAPMWFNVLDLALAYIPMSYLAAKLVIRNE